MTDEGIATEGKLLQPKKQSLPKDVTDEGIVTEVSPLQYWKHRLLIDVIDEGIVTEVSPLQDWKQFRGLQGLISEYYNFKKNSYLCRVIKR